MNMRRRWRKAVLGAALSTSPVWLVSCRPSSAGEAQGATAARQEAAAPGDVARAPEIAGEARQSSTEAPQEVAITVHKRTGCGCCTKWVEHLEEHGFAVTATEVPEPELQALKRQLGVPSTLQSCHTATVNGYAIEGHVPADVIRRFLAEAPQMAGLAVPGMPLGSPGMEVAGREGDAYDVVAFDRDGNTSVYESR